MQKERVTYLPAICYLLCMPLYHGQEPVSAIVHDVPQVHVQLCNPRHAVHCVGLHTPAPTCAHAVPAAMSQDKLLNRNTELCSCKRCIVPVPTVHIRYVSVNTYHVNVLKLLGTDAAFRSKRGIKIAVIYVDSKVRRSERAKMYECAWAA